MAIAALLLWMCTAAVGGYLLATSSRPGDTAPASDDSVPVPEAARSAGSASQATQAAPAAAVATARPARDRNRFDPPSLARAKSEPLPGMRALAEFAHPALAIVGLGFWLGYVLTRDRVFAAIGFGILLGAICAGLSWFAANVRAAKRTTPGPRTAPLSVTPRLLILHGAGAFATLVIAALIAARA